MNSKRKILGIGIMVAGVIASVALYLYQKPADRVVTQDAEYSVNAIDIFNEFDANEAQANKKYLNKVVSVAGEVSDISAVDSIGINIVLTSENPLFGVSCQLPFGAPDSSVKVGDLVQITGLCTGKLMDVVLVRCRIEKTGKVKVNKNI
jgi:hypothetical protein